MSIQDFACSYWENVSIIAAAIAPAFSSSAKWPVSKIAEVGRRHGLLYEFRGRRQDKRVIPPPHDERLRLPVLQVGGPFRVVL